MDSKFNIAIHVPREISFKLAFPRAAVLQLVGYYYEIFLCYSVNLKSNVQTATRFTNKWEFMMTAWKNTGILLHICRDHI